jgi:hypothetical protein
VIFEALPGVETILVSVEPSRPDAWRKKEVLRVIEILRSKGRPLVLYTKDGPEVFVPEGWVRADVEREIQSVMDWKEKMNDRSVVHD